MQLRNPKYLMYLQEEGYFDDIDFIFYLKYLLSYWELPQFHSIIVSVQQPQALSILRLVLAGVNWNMLQQPTSMPPGSPPKNWKGYFLKEMERSAEFAVQVIQPIQ